MAAVGRGLGWTISGRLSSAASFDEMVSISGDAAASACEAAAAPACLRPTRFPSARFRRGRSHRDRFVCLRRHRGNRGLLCWRKRAVARRQWRRTPLASASGVSFWPGAGTLGAWSAATTGFAGVAGSGADVCSGFNAATLSGSLARATDARLGAAGEAAVGSAGVATFVASSTGDAVAGAFDAETFSGAFNSTGAGSACSIARTGVTGSACCCANVASGAACHEGLLANCSCAARSSAAAPSPNTSIEVDNVIAASRKRKPGSMER